MKLLPIFFFFGITSIGAHDCRALQWDYPPTPEVIAFRMYACPLAGGYDFGQPYPHAPCGYRAVELSEGGLDTEMLCIKAKLDTTPVYLVVTAVGVSGEESGPSNAIRHPFVDPDPSALPTEPPFVAAQTIPMIPLGSTTIRGAG